MHGLRGEDGVKMYAVSHKDAHNHVVQTFVDYATTAEGPQGMQRFVRGVAVCSSKNQIQANLVHLTEEGKIKMPPTISQTHLQAVHGQRLATRSLAEVLNYADDDNSLTPVNSDLNEAYIVITDVALRKTIGTAVKSAGRAPQSPGNKAMNDDVANINRTFAKHPHLQYQPMQLRFNGATPAETWITSHWQRQTSTKWSPLQGSNAPRARSLKFTNGLETQQEPGWTTVPTRKPPLSTRTANANARQATNTRNDRHTSSNGHGRNQTGGKASMTIKDLQQCLSVDQNVTHTDGEPTHHHASNNDNVDTAKTNTATGLRAHRLLTTTWQCTPRQLMQACPSVRT